MTFYYKQVKARLDDGETEMKMIPPVGSHVFVNAERGTTPGMAQVTRVEGTQARFATVHLKYLSNGEADAYYPHHLHVTRECFIKDREARLERSAKVGAGKQRRKG